MLADSCVKAPTLPVAVVPGLSRAHRFCALTGGVVAFSEKGAAENEGKITIRFQ